MQILEQIATFDYSSVFSAPVISALIASSVALWGIKTQRSISRQKNSLDFESAYKRNPELIKHNDVIIQLIHDIRSKVIPDPVLYLTETAKANYQTLPDPELAKARNKSISTILNEWERTANATFSGLYDEDYLYKANGTAILEIYTALKPYIQVRQALNPRLFINITILCIRWGTRRCKEDNKNMSTKLTAQLNVLKDIGVSFSGHEVREKVHGHLSILDLTACKMNAIVTNKWYKKSWVWIKSKFV